MDRVRAKDVNNHVRNYYRDLYENVPSSRFSALPITTGRKLAEFLGYPQDILNLLPESYWERFVPCGNAIPHLQPRHGDRILNLGCGVALDSLCLHLRHGEAIEIAGLDIVFSVLQRSRNTFRQLFPHQGNECRWICGDAEHLPFRTESFDWVILNGVFNLFKDKLSLLRAIKEILKPEGSLVVLDLCCKEPLPPYFNEEMDAWAWCMSGACTEGEIHSLLDAADLEAERMIREEDADSFYRIAFTCRKVSPLRSREQNKSP